MRTESDIINRNDDAQGFEAIPHPFPEFDGYSANEPTMETFIDQFARQANRTPHAVALAFEGEALTYRELDVRSNQLVHFLNAAGVNKGHAVALCINPSLHMVAAFIGIWKAGAAYVPVDPDLPAARIAHILAQTQAKAALAGNGTAGIAQLAETGCLADLDDPDSPVWKHSEAPPQNRPAPEDTAYVIYTSGSTGMPKGVAVSHGAITDYLGGLARHLPQFASSKHFALGSPIYTDLGNTVLYGALLNGGTLHIFAKERFNDFAYTNGYFKENGIDCLKIVPSHWKFLSDGKNALVPNKLLIFGGEKLPGSFVRAVHEANPDCTVANHYGPTETTIGKLLHVAEPTREYGPTVPIGKPFSNASVYVLDEQLRHCPVGTPGELHIGGAGLATEYIGQPELTRNAFATVTDKNGQAQRVYKTGDIVRWLPDGNIEYLERKDGQVKIRGNRIELAEIEHQLRALPGIRDAVAAVWEETPGNPSLAAYLVGEALLPQAELPAAFTAAWRQQLLDALPHYMVPSAWVAIERVPLNANNKADRNALPKPQRRKRQPQEADYATYSPSQRLAAAVWSRVLKREHVALDDDFFELGGHSLLAMQVLREIKQDISSPLPLATLFKNPVLRDFAYAIQEAYAPDASALPDAATNTDSSAAIKPSGAYLVPMIAPQHEIWLSCQLGGDEANLAYNQSVTIHLNGLLNVDALRDAVDATVDRHEALRARIDAGSEALAIRPDYRNALSTVSLEHFFGEAEKSEAFEQFLHEEMRTPFDLDAGPLFRAHLHSFGPATHKLTLVAHHIICDAIAMRVLVRDIAAHYNTYAQGHPLNLGVAPQLSTYAVEETAFAKSPEHRQMLDFWLAQHRNSTETLDLPLDFSRPATRTYRGDAAKHQLARSVYPGLSGLARQAGMSLAAALTAIVEVFLHHRTGQPEITLGLTTAGQFLNGHDDMVGHCVNLLPLKTTIESSQPVAQYLAQRRDSLYDAYENQRLTFGELLRELDLQRDRAHVPLVPFVATIHVDGEATPVFEGLDVTLAPNPHASYTFEIFLNIHIDTRKGTIAILWAYNTQLFSRQTIQRMMSEFELLLTTVIATPDVPIGKSLPSPHPFPDYAHYRCPYPTGSTLLDHIVSKAREVPNATAVLFEGKEITFGELDRRSNQLAHHLTRIGTVRNPFVLLCAAPSIELVVAFLGIWKAGGAYVPIDPELPEERIAHIADKTGANTVILNSETRHIGPLVALCHAILIDQPDCPAWECPDVPLVDLPTPDDNAYVIYTSGSTGNPKGVVITHASLTDYYFGLVRHLPQLLDCKEYILGSPIYTDLGNTVLYGSLLQGGRLHLFSKERFNDPDHIGRYVAANPIDFLKIVPSHWNHFSKLGVDIAPQKILMLGGEGLPSSIVNQLRQAGKQCAVVNEYGPTETTIGKLMHVVDPDRAYGAEIPIGVPYSNASIYVLNQNMVHCPVGVPGELYIGGIGLASGYLAEPEVTAHAFSEVSIEGDVQRLYKTGDIVRWLPNGEVEYLGRKDEQVKIRGNRIEIAEIEDRISKLDEVAQCAVLTMDGPSNEKELVGYLVLHPNTLFDKESVAKRLREALPEYMVPKQWASIPTIPLNANGKADKKALLRAGYVIQRKEHEYVAPTTPTQQKLVEFWTECLDTETKIGITHDFFELGGQSYRAVWIMSKIKQHFGLQLPLASLFEHVTIEKLAQVIDKGIDPLQWDCVIPIRPSGSKPPLFMVHGGLLDVLFARLALPYLDPDQPLYGIQGMGLSGKSKPAHSVEKIAEHYVSQVLSLEPNGPYAVAGYSSGGVIAYEMARQLQQQGKNVSFLGLFDSHVPKGYRNLRDVVNFGKLIVNGLSAFYGRKTAFLYFSLIGIDKFSQWTLAKISPQTHSKLFPPNYRRFKGQLIYALVDKKYRGAPCEVNTVLFQSPQDKNHANDDPISATNGWSALIKHKLKITPVSTPHHSIFGRNQVQDAASKLRAELSKTWDNTHIKRNNF